MADLIWIGNNLYERDHIIVGALILFVVLTAVVGAIDWLINGPHRGR